MRDFGAISNVTALDCDSLCSIIVTGLPEEPLRNITLSNIHLQFQGGGARPDNRPAVVLDDVKEAVIRGLVTPDVYGVEKVVTFNSSDIRVIF